MAARSGPWETCIWSSFTSWNETGFDAFELESDDPLGDMKIASADFDVWYQPAADDRLSAVQLRHRAG